MSFRAFEIMANLAKRRPLRGIQAVCETQHQISTRKLEQYVEIAGNELADYAFNLRNEFDKIERERNAALAECERLRLDAERYRLYRQGMENPEAFDAGVDAALSAKP